MNDDKYSGHNFGETVENVVNAMNEGQDFIDDISRLEPEGRHEVQEAYANLAESYNRIKDEDMRSVEEDDITALAWDLAQADNLLSEYQDKIASEEYTKLRSLYTDTIGLDGLDKEVASEVDEKHYQFADLEEITPEEVFGIN